MPVAATEKGNVVRYILKVEKGRGWMEGMRRQGRRGTAEVGWWKQSSKVNRWEGCKRYERKRCRWTPHLLLMLGSSSTCRKRREEQRSAASEGSSASSHFLTSGPHTPAKPARNAWSTLHCQWKWDEGKQLRMRDMFLLECHPGLEGDQELSSALSQALFARGESHLWGCPRSRLQRRKAFCLYLCPGSSSERRDRVCLQCRTQLDCSPVGLSQILFWRGEGEGGLCSPPMQGPCMPPAPPPGPLRWHLGSAHERDRRSATGLPGPPAASRRTYPCTGRGQEDRSIGRDQAEKERPCSWLVLSQGHQQRVEEQTTAQKQTGEVTEACYSCNTSQAR